MFRNPLFFFCFFPLLLVFQAFETNDWDVSITFCNGNPQELNFSSNVFEKTSPLLLNLMVGGGNQQGAL